MTSYCYQSVIVGGVVKVFRRIIVSLWNYSDEL